MSCFFHEFHVFFHEFHVFFHEFHVFSMNFSFFSCIFPFLVSWISCFSMNFIVFPWISCFFHEFHGFFNVFFHEFHVFFMNFMFFPMNFMIFPWISGFFFHVFFLILFHEFHVFSIQGGVRDTDFLRSKYGKLSQHGHKNDFNSVQVGSTYPRQGSIIKKRVTGKANLNFSHQKKIYDINQWAGM